MADDRTTELMERVLAGVVGNPFIPNEYKGVPLFPSPKQATLFLRTEPELLFGGAVGGGKTIGVLMDSMRFVHVPGYAAVFFRRTYPELDEPGGLIPTMREWLANTPAIFHETSHQARFPSGATISFKHLLNDAAAVRAGRGPTYNRVYFEELTTFTEFQYRQLWSRLRRSKSGPLARVPAAFRSTSNPGGEGHDWVKARFVDRKTAVAPFILSRVTDNPGLDVDEYIRNMRHGLDPVTLQRMLDGDWEVQEGGFLFDRSKFVLVDECPPGRRVRSWDCAATTGPNSKYTAGVRMTKTPDGRYFIDDVVRFKKRPGERDRAILATAAMDGHDCAVLIEREGGSGGAKQAEDQVKMLAGFNVMVDRDTGDKFTRAAPLARQTEISNVFIVRTGPWVGPLLDELQGAHPKAKYLDQMDAAAAAFNHLARVGQPGAYTSGAKKSAGGRQRVFDTSRRRRVF